MVPHQPAVIVNICIQYCDRGVQPSTAMSQHNALHCGLQIAHYQLSQPAIAMTILTRDLLGMWA